MNFVEQIPNQKDVIDPMKWATDHWILLYWAEKYAVGASGKVPTEKMRANAAKHAWLKSVDDFGMHATVLRSGEEVADYDDYDCLMDLAGADLLTVLFPVDGPTCIPYVHQMGELRWGVKIELTPKGWKWAGFIRRWLAEGRDINALTFQYVTRTDRGSVNQVAQMLLGSDAVLSRVLHQMQITEIGEEPYRALLVKADPPITSCVECQAWVLIADSRDGLCEDCFKNLIVLDKEAESWAYEQYDLGEEWPVVY